MKLRTGYLTKWKDEQGYGFIQSRRGKGKEVFLHINAFGQRHRRPRVGDVIYYQLALDKTGRAYARYASHSRVRLRELANATVKPAQQNDSFKPAVGSISLSLTLEVLLLSLLPVLGSIHLVFTTGNPIPLILYPVMSWITYTLYAKDKSRAKAKERGSRITEKTLHLYEFLGGWLGGFVAQRRLHHKSRKVSYQKVFWTIVLVHQLLWCGWFVLQVIW